MPSSMMKPNADDNHNRLKLSPQHRDDVDGDEEEFENDSELGEDLHIDATGNVLSDDGLRLGDGSTFGANSCMAHILAGYGTDICEQLIAQFIKLELNHRHLSSLTDADLELLGIREPSVRSQMLAEFAELRNQQYVPPPKPATLAEQQQADTKTAQLMLSNVYKHLNCLKTSLSVVLLRLYVRPTDNVLINDHQYASSVVLSTLDELSANVAAMERRLLDMQYGKIRFDDDRTTSARTTSRSSKRIRWFALLGGLCSIGGVFAMRYLPQLKRSLQY